MPVHIALKATCERPAPNTMAQAVLFDYAGAQSRTVWDDESGFLRNEPTKLFVYSSCVCTRPLCSSVKRGRGLAHWRALGVRTLTYVIVYVAVATLLVAYPLPAAVALIVVVEKINGPV